jgi:alkyl hydroperoxide reductase subunit AhpC
MTTIRLGDTAPDFTQDSTEGPINFHDFLGDGWGILFSHPADFTPVCTTELGTVARLKPEFDRRNTRAVGLSVDPIGSHNDWVGDIAETQGTPINFPLLADHDRKVAELYDMVEGDAATATVRSVFIVDPAKKVRLTLTYPPSTGAALKRSSGSSTLCN